MNQSSKSTSANAYYTVPEFAELAGVSKQAVYQRIKKDLKHYTIKKDGVTMISSEALDRVGNRDESKVDQAESSEVNFQLDCEASEVDQLLNQSSEPLDQLSKAIDQESKINQSSESSALLDYVLRENSRLLGEIERLNALIVEKDAAISDFATRFAAIAEKEQEISTRALATTGQAQMLHAMSEQSDAIDAPQEPTEADKKRHWWNRKGK